MHRLAATLALVTVVGLSLLLAGLVLDRRANPAPLAPVELRVGSGSPAATAQSAGGREARGRQSGGRSDVGRADRPPGLQSGPAGIGPASGAAPAPLPAPCDAGEEPDDADEAGDDCDDEDDETDDESREADEDRDDGGDD